MKKVDTEYQSIKHSSFIRDFSFYVANGYEIFVKDEDGNKLHDWQFPVNCPMGIVHNVDELICDVNHGTVFRFLGRPQTLYHLYIANKTLSKKLGLKFVSIYKETFEELKENKNENYSVDISYCSNCLMYPDKSHSTIFDDRVKIIRFTKSCFNSFIKYYLDNKRDLGSETFAPIWGVKKDENEVRYKKYHVNLLREEELSRKDLRDIKKYGLFQLNEVIFKEDADKVKKMINYIKRSNATETTKGKISTEWKKVLDKISK